MHSLGEYNKDVNLSYGAGVFCFFFATGQRRLLCSDQQCIQSPLVWAMFQARSQNNIMCLYTWYAFVV